MCAMLSLITYLVSFILATYLNTAHTMSAPTRGFDSTVLTDSFLRTKPRRYRFLCARKHNAHSNVCSRTCVRRSFTTTTTDSVGSELRRRACPTRQNPYPELATSSRQAKVSHLDPVLYVPTTELLSSSC